MGQIVLGVLEYQEAKRVRAKLEELGVPSELISNPDTCQSGCTATVELRFDEAYVEKVKAFVKEERSRSYAGLNFNPENVDQVFDAEQAEAQCPACGTRFQTGLGTCPDCGLVFISDGMTPEG